MSVRSEEIRQTTRRRNSTSAELDVIEWRDAILDAVDVATSTELLAWLDEYVRPLVDYSMTMCGSGMLRPEAIRVNRLLMRNVPERSLDMLRDVTGVVTFRGIGREFGEFELLDRKFGDKHFLPRRPESKNRVAVHVQQDSTARSGTFFLFGGLNKMPSLNSRLVLTLIAPSMHAMLLRALESEEMMKSAVEPLVILTKRETEMVTWLVAGRNSTEIAISTNRSVHTINNQMRALLTKLRANNRTEAAFLAVCFGLVQPLEGLGRTRMIAAQRRASYGACDDEPSLSDRGKFVVAKASDDVIVDQSAGLQVRVYDR